MTAPVYGPIEAAVRDWLKTTDVAPLVTRVDGTIDIYRAMPKSSPVPVIVLTLVGGGPLRRADLPITRYRVRFNVVGKSLDQAGQIARTLVGELTWLGQGDAGEVFNGVYLGAADVLTMHWLPDLDSDTPRYIVDALITTVL